MRFLYVSDLVRNFLHDFDTFKLLDPNGQSLVILNRVDCRTPLPDTAIFYTNRPPNSILPIFDFAEILSGHTCSKSIFVSAEETLVVTVVAQNLTDATTIANQCIGFIKTL